MEDTNVVEDSDDRVNEDLPSDRVATNDSRISGRVLVVAMFLFGIAATATMWIYWNLHLTPFMPLQKALAAEFEDSSPRVSGGQRKISRNTPKIMRVVMRMPFDPTTDSEEIRLRVDSVVQRIRELAAEHAQLGDYEILEVHLFQEIQHPSENEIRSDVIRRSIDAWQDVDADGNPVAE